MRRLTKTQITYLIERKDALVRKLSAQDLQKLGPPPELLEYTHEQKLELIRTKKAVLKENSGERHYSNVTAFFSYPPTAAMRKRQAQRKVWEDESKAITNKWAAESQRLEDQIVLGDTAEAMQMIEALERRVGQAKAA